MEVYNGNNSINISNNSSASYGGNFNNVNPGNVIGENKNVTVKVTTVVSGFASCKFFIKGTVTLIPIS